MVVIIAVRAPLEFLAPSRTPIEHKQKEPLTVRRWLAISVDPRSTNDERNLLDSRVYNHRIHATNDNNICSVIQTMDHGR